MTGGGPTNGSEGIAQNILRDLQIMEASKFAEIDNAKKAGVAELTAQTRNKLGHIIVCTYACFVLLAMLYFGYLAIICQQDVASSIMELGKVMILPVITLVLGHFYGSKS